MDYQTRNGEQVGDLIHYIDYTVRGNPQDYIGVLVGYNGVVDAFIVLCEGVERSWLAWQCEVVS